MPDTTFTPEAEEILSRPPNWLLKTGPILLFSVFLMILLASAVIRYPDYVQVKMKILSTKSLDPIRPAEEGLVMDLFVHSDSIAKKGDVLAFINSSNVHHADVVHTITALRNLINTFHQTQRISSSSVRSVINSKKMEELKENPAIASDIAKWEASQNVLSIPIPENSNKEISLLNLLLNHLEQFLIDHSLVMPIDGYVYLTPLVKTGAQVSQRQVLFSYLRSDAAFFGRAALTQESFFKLKTGQKAILNDQSDGSGILNGQVEALYSSPQGKGFTVDIKFPILSAKNEDSKYLHKPGIILNGRINISNPTVLEKFIFKRQR